MSAIGCLASRLRAATCRLMPLASATVQWLPIECRMRILCLATLALSAHAVGADERPEPPARSEPKVELLVTEDDAVRIEELRVRGQVQRITVTPKTGGKVSYQIIPGDSSRDVAAGTSASRGAAGQRVWNVLSF